MAEFAAKHQPSEVTERLDALYGTEPSRLDPDLRRMQRRSLERNSSQALRPCTSVARADLERPGAKVLVSCSGAYEQSAQADFVRL